VSQLPTRVPDRVEEIDRRRYPRVPIPHPVEIVGGRGQRLRVPVQDLSPDGIQLRCNVKIARKLKQAALADSAVESAPLRLRIALPLAGSDVEISALGRLVWMRALARDRIAVGVQFTDVSGESARRLERFIALALEPR